MQESGRSTAIDGGVFAKRSSGSNRLPQPQNSNHISSAPLKEKLLTNSSYLAAEIPHKFGHWVSNFWQHTESCNNQSDGTLWLLGKSYDMPDMSKMQQDMLAAQSENVFDKEEQPKDEQDEVKKKEAPVSSFSMSMLWPPDFYEDFTSRLWMTYRHNYPPIRPSSYTTDIGWGCMLRSGQSLLANALLIHFLGRDWRRKGAASKEYRQIIQWFLDELSPRAPFSIHRIALLGKQLGKNIGEWFGPSTISQVILALVSDFPAANLAVYIATDGVVYRQDVHAAATGRRPRGEFGYWHKSTRRTEDKELEEIYKKSTPRRSTEPELGEFRPILVLVAIRLGIDNLHPTYYPALKDCFKLPWFVGIAGGRPNSSLYFIGMQGDELLYLDPHFSRPALETKHIDEYNEQDLETYHCAIPRKIHISQLDPSMLLGYYCRTQADFDAFCERVSEIASAHTAIFTIENKAPEYDEDVRSENDFGIVSEDEVDDDDDDGDDDDNLSDREF